MKIDLVLWFPEQFGNFLLFMDYVVLAPILGFSFYLIEKLFITTKEIFTS